MTRRAQTLIVSIVVSASTALPACNRSEELGHLPDAAVGDDAGVDGACQGLCLTPPLGTPCTSPAGCGSGFCVDGVCCNTACTGSGMTCNAAGSVGTCTAAAAQANGATCNQASECASGFCVDGVCCDTACTDSTMTCFSVGSIGTCTPVFVPQPRANGVACKQGSECASGFCVDGVCCNTACADSSMTCDGVGSVGTCTAATTSTPQALGTSCTTAVQCASAFCVGGVCCDTACAGSCMTCGAAGAVGTCTPVAACP
ncbi:MAG TPA: hypothetical protein VKZ18_07305 [Polyangia bacterium]|nr:hypothetical protein [Polyangia bacterium]